MTDVKLEYDRRSIFDKVDLESLMSNKSGVPKALFNVINSRVLTEFPDARLLGNGPIVVNHRGLDTATLVVHYEIEPRSGHGVAFKVPLVKSERKPGTYLVKYLSDSHE